MAGGGDGGPVGVSRRGRTGGGRRLWPGGSEGRGYGRQQTLAVPPLVASCTDAGLCTATPPPPAQAATGKTPSPPPPPPALTTIYSLQRSKHKAGSFFSP